LPNVPVREIKNLWPAVFSGTIPSHAPKLPANLKSNRGLPGSGCRCEQHPLPAMQDGLQDPVNGYFLIVALSFANCGVSRRENSARRLLVGYPFGSAESLP
jgi:hypothetical protein